MGLPFFESGTRKKRDQTLAVDLGNRTTKAVHVQRRGAGYVLCGYAVVDAPIFEKTMSAELLSEHLKSVNEALGGRAKTVTLALGVSDALVRPVEMPPLPVEDLRMVLKHNSKTYLQQDLSSHVFDCHIGSAERQTKPPEGAKGSAATQKARVLIAAARKQLVSDFLEGARGAGLVADNIVPGLIGPVNAFELAMPEVFQNDVVAVVDIGFKHSTICILQQGELVLSRTVAIGGDRLTTSLSESMNISYAEAEGIKVGMAQEVESALQATLAPLGRELRASIDFFEHQQDKAVSQVFVSGGSARSSVVIQALESELMLECKTWHPAAFLQTDLTPDQAADLEQVGPQLTVALGAAFTVL